MTTRAGLTGLLTGLMTTIIIFPLFIAWQNASLHGGLVGATFYARVAVVLTVIIMISGGLMAARWSKSICPGRCAALGGLAGGLAGAIVFCLWGAAAVGLVGPVTLFDQVINNAICQDPQVEVARTIICQTLGMFLLLFLGGSGLGMVGGWLVCPSQGNHADSFDKVGPQMALNVSITAVPASIVAATLAAAIFSRLADLVGLQTNHSNCIGAIQDMPLVVSLLLVLFSHFALTMVVPHEARQAKHLCGMDEVKMGAYVGIGASPVLIILLILIEPDYFTNPLVITALLACTGMSLKSLHTLFKLILPRRASFPAPQESWKKTEASLFGTISSSSGTQLVELCIGCGLVMVLPLYVSVLSILINLNIVWSNSAFTLIPDTMWHLFLIQALVSMGLVTVSIVVLSAIYLFYLNLGRWFSKWNSHRLN